MKKVTNRDARKGLLQGLAVFAGLMVFAILYHPMEAALEYDASWVRYPEGWKFGPLSFWYMAWKVFRSGMMIPVGFCLSLGFHFRGLKSRFCLNWGWLAAAVFALAFMVAGYWIPWYQGGNNKFVFAPGIAVSSAQIASVLQGLFLGHCLRMGLFAGKGEKR